MSEHCETCGTKLEWLFISQYCPNEDNHEIEKLRGDEVWLYGESSELKCAYPFFVFQPGDIVHIMDFDFDTNQYECLILKHHQHTGQRVRLNRSDVNTIFQPISSANCRIIMLPKEEFDTLHMRSMAPYFVCNSNLQI